MFEKQKFPVPLPFLELPLLNYLMMFLPVVITDKSIEKIGCYTLPEITKLPSQLKKFS
jgi:hypothetical protein